MAPVPVERAVDDSRRFLGIGLFCIALLFFTGLDTSAKLASASLPALQIVWARFIGHLVIASATYGILQRGRMRRVNAPWLQLARSACLLLATACNFTALRHLQLTETVSIFFSVPLMVTALAVPFLGERVGPRRWAAIIVGFLGVLVIIRPGFGIVHWAVLFSLAAALSTAAYQLLTRRLAAIDDVVTTQALTPVVGALVLLPVMPLVWVTPATAFEWVLLAAAGACGAIGHYLFIVAHRHAPAAILAPFIYLQILYVTIVGLLVFGQLPDIWVYVGAAIVIASGVYVWSRERVRRSAGRT